MLEQIVSELHRRGHLPHGDVTRYFVAFNNRANVNFVLFDRSDEARRVFVKASDMRDFHAVLGLMQRLHELVDDMIPEPYCSFEVGTYQVLATRAHRLELLAGSPGLSPTQSRRMLEGALEKLVALHAETIEGVLTLNRDYFERQILPMARRFFDQWPERDLLQRFERHLESMLEEPPLVVPRIPQHGDLGAFNIALVDGDPGRLFFIDWDSYGDVDLAGLDIVTLLASFERRGSKSGLEPDELSRAGRRYCEGVGLDPALLSRLTPVSWLQYAAIKLDIGVRDGQRVAYQAIKRFLTQAERCLPA